MVKLGGQAGTAAEPPLQEEEALAKLQVKKIRHKERCRAQTYVEASDK
jgi:hypothetical protein